MSTQVGHRQIKSKVVRLLTGAAAIICAMLISVLPTAAAQGPVHIVAFGDSLTAGYGLPPGADFASRLEAALTRNGHAVKITNAGVSGDTTSGGLARFDWAVPDGTDAVILELGANDALRGIAPAIARTNLDKILAKLQARGIAVLIAGMRAPANWGEAYTKAFDAIFPALADKYNAGLYPFFLEGVIGKTDLKLDDGLHPNQAGVDAIVNRILPDVVKLIGRVKEK